jgi:hypothetical protein
MVILDGQEGELFAALRMVADRPNPDHLEEDRIISGRVRGIREMLIECVEKSSFAAFSVRDGEVLVGGVTMEPRDGLFKHQLWLVSTAGAARWPRWMVREGRRMLAGADAVFRWPRGYVQAIPAMYRQGVEYAKRMGFSVGRKYLNNSGDEIFVMTRMIPKWA